MTPSRSAPLNIPQGNSQITADPETIGPDDTLTGDRFTDLKRAAARIDPIKDLENIGKIPCARSSLLYGIGGGVGIGLVRFLGSRRPYVAANWAIGSFMLISAFTWNTCNSARAKELQNMRTIQERFADRHVSRLKKRIPVEIAEEKPQG